MSYARRRISNGAPLPAGWEDVITETGRLLFVNHIERRCSWIDPRDDPRRPRQPNELPYGWTLEWDPLAGEYFCDHQKKRVTKRDPRTGKELPWPTLDSKGVPIQVPTPRRPASISGKGNRSRSTSRSRINQRDRWDSIAMKLQAIKQEFEENNSVLKRMRRDIQAIISDCQIAADHLQPEQPETPPTDGVAQYSLQKRRALLRAYAPVNQDLVQDIETSSLTRSELSIDSHLVQLTDFIGDQHTEVEALRKLQSGLLTVTPGNLQLRLAQLDKLAYAALQQFFDPALDIEHSHQEKIDYLNKLIDYAVQASK